MNYSLNEAQTLARKAARGAGYPWGLAEEAGMAVAWLMARDIDGCGSLARLLEAVDGEHLPNHGLASLSLPWKASSGFLCPIWAGASLCDCAYLLAENPIRLGGVVEPVLVLPFAAAAASQMGGIATLDWKFGQAVTDGSQISLIGNLPAEGLSDPIDMVVSKGGHVGLSQPIQTRANPKPEDWVELERFAHRTYAPATEQSRELGAGAGLTDND